MSKIDEILDRLREPITTGRLTKREYARRAGLHHAHLAKMHRNDWNPTAKVIRKLEAARADKRPLVTRRASEMRSAA